MRILPATILTPAITAFTATLLRVARTILALPSLTDAMLAQAQLPGHLGDLDRSRLTPHALRFDRSEPAGRHRRCWQGRDANDHLRVITLIHPLSPGLAG